MRRYGWTSGTDNVPEAKSLKGNLPSADTVVECIFLLQDLVQEGSPASAALGLQDSESSSSPSTSATFISLHCRCLFLISNLRASSNPAQRIFFLNSIRPICQ
ncbi:hypothetical protein O181_088697 [Austropuccinia psidii MF-1]|uniref:Uncharacterized protein n=1 Tax=Austropuccinia psidii MF-1 TaxID=1389203 RepID=A0A9Q3IS08_9BASI|nr:hypothetical protein [Austropuccinia psidii MF-1]